MQSCAWHVVRMQDEQRGVVVDRIGTLRHPRVGDAMNQQAIAGRGGRRFLQITGEEVLADRAGKESHRAIVPVSRSARPRCVLPALRPPSSKDAHAVSHRDG